MIKEERSTNKQNYLNPVAFYARVSSDLQDVVLSAATQLPASGTTPRRAAARWCGNTSTRPKAA